MSSDVNVVIQELSTRLGDDADAVALIAVLAASWTEMAARLQVAEEATGVAFEIAAESVQQVGVGMDGFKQQVEAGDAQLVELHQKIKNLVDAAGQHSGAAKDAMGDVLATYNRFSGNVQQLKTGVGSLAKSVIGSAVPGAAHLLNPRVDRLLGI